MTLSELRYLTAVADHRHFGRAAAACHVSQPTLSTQVRKLEASLKIQVFERGRRALRITPRGEEVIARARRVLAEADGLLALARAERAPLSARMTLGFIPTLSPFLLPWLLPVLKKDHADLEPVVIEAVTDDLLRALTEHRLDAAFVALPVGAADLAAIALFEEPFWLAVPDTHALAKRDSVSVDELKTDTLLLLADGHCLRDQALEVCRRPHAAAGGDFAATGLETLRRMVAGGLGLTLLPAMALENPGGDEDGLHTLRLAEGGSRTIGLVHRRSYPDMRDMDLLGAAVRRAVPRTVTLLDADGQSG